MAARSGRNFTEYEREHDFGTTSEPAPGKRRGRKGPPRALEWDEVDAALEAGAPQALAFDHAAVLERVEAKGDLFALLLSEEQQLPNI
jgi:DNA primase